jgi:hypothetical protein
MSALNELRESLREAARADIEAARARRRRVRRRTGGLLAVLLVGGAAAAGATDLISVGEPAKPPAKDLPPTYAQGSRVQLLVTASSGRKERFGLGSYKNKSGVTCVLMGYVRGAQLGIIERGTFRPYPTSISGPCGANPYGDIRIGDHTLLGGLAAPGVRRVVVAGGWDAKPGKDGAWLLVFKGRVPPGTFHVSFQ